MPSQAAYLRLRSRVKSTSASQLISRSQKNLTTDYPAIAQAIDALPGGNAILDGEHRGTRLMVSQR